MLRLVVALKRRLGTKGRYGLAQCLRRWCGSEKAGVVLRHRAIHLGKHQGGWWGRVESLQSVVAQMRDYLSLVSGGMDNAIASVSSYGCDRPVSCRRNVLRKED